MSSQENPHLALGTGTAFAVWDDYQAGWWQSYGTKFGSSPQLLGP